MGYGKQLWRTEGQFVCARRMCSEVLHEARSTAQRLMASSGTGDGSLCLEKYGCLRVCLVLLQKCTHALNDFSLKEVMYINGGHLILCNRALPPQIIQKPLPLAFAGQVRVLCLSYMYRDVQCSCA